MPINKKSNKQNLERIRDILVTKKFTLSIAESVTCGLLQFSFSQIEDTTSFFQGGITAYNLGQKVRHLHIDPIAGENCNCISEKTAMEMATGANALFSSDISLSITGYASPDPGKGIKKLFAWFAIAFRDEIIFCDKIEPSAKGIEKVQEEYVTRILEETSRILRKEKL